ncbi:MAG: DUF4340 domain-containing protein [Candidatus Rokubacteria bacterium]|nr:DUF4340 domain-containing protein [Candidatus Rokubacteria bacterium]
MPKTVGVLRDKVVLAYAYDKVAKIALEHAKGGVTLERDGGGWKLTAPEPLKADPGAVNGVLWLIRDLRASGFLSEDARDIPRYLAKPEVTVRIWEEGAKEPKVLLVASSRETRGGQPVALAAVAGQGPVMLVEGKAREARVSDLLLTLKALRWKEIASAKSDNAARFGLDRPELEVTLSKADGAELATLLVGKEEGDRTYVRVKTSPPIYVIDSKLVRDLRKAPADIPG